MPIRWSRIHAELGLAPAPLTHDMVVRAVESGMAESDDLDWKQALPPEVEKKRREVAKDVAAMANTRGGLIIYGVREENERAVELTGVLNGERDRQALRSLANRYVRPLVDGLLIEALDGEPDAPGLIALFVPPSPDAPHVIGDQDQLGVPYRYGTDTHWMSESQLERAYRDRFSRRTDDRTALTALIDDLIPEINLTNGVWVAMSARPIAPMPLLASRPKPEQATKAILEARPLAAEILKETRSQDLLLEHLPADAVNNPRNGLRRWVIRSNHYSTDPQELIDWALVELHHDGSVALAIGLGGFMRGMKIAAQTPGVLHVPYKLVDTVIAEAVALISAHVRGLGGVGTILTRAALLRSGNAPLVVIDNQLGAGFSSLFHRPPTTQPVRKPVAVESAFSADDDIVAVRAVARQLADDLDQQFGLRSSSIPE